MISKHANENTSADRLSLTTILYLVLFVFHLNPLYSRQAATTTGEREWLALKVNETQNGFTYLSDGSLLLENVLLAKTQPIPDEPGDVMLISPASANGTFVLALPTEQDKGAWEGYIVNIKKKSVVTKINSFELRPLWRWVAWSSDERYVVFGGSQVQTLAFVQLQTGYLRTLSIHLERTYGNNWKEIQSFDLNNFQWSSSSSFSLPVKVFCNYYDDPNCTGGAESNLRSLYKVLVNLETGTFTSEQVEFSVEMVRKQLEAMISEVRSSIEDLKRQNLNPSIIEKSLNDATDALNNQKYENAQSTLKLARSNVAIIWDTYHQIQSAKVEINVAKEIGCDTLPAAQKVKLADDALQKGDYSQAAQIAAEASQLARKANCGNVTIQDLRAMASKYDQRNITISGEVKTIDPKLGQGYRITLDDGSGIATARYSESMKKFDVGDRVVIEGIYSLSGDFIYAAKIEHGPFFTLGRIVLILLLVVAGSAGVYYRHSLLQGTKRLGQSLIPALQRMKTLAEATTARMKKSETELTTKPTIQKEFAVSTYHTYLSPVGALLAAVCFFLPWVEFKCAGMRDTASGSQIGGLLWIVFISAIVVIGAFFYFREQKQLDKAKRPILISSIVGIATLLLRYITFLSSKVIEYRGEEIPLKYIDYSIQFGAIGTLIGLILSSVGVRYLRSVQDETAPSAKLQPAVFDPSKLTKRCPACKEEIKLEARMCRFCHTQFSDDEVNQAISFAKQHFEAQKA